MTQEDFGTVHQSSAFDPSRRAKRAIGPLLASWIIRSIAWLEARHRTRRAVVELMAMDDRMLADIGVSRGEILHAARHGLERTKL
jgi:uncharacterized protein YjiS (DUF1127 family)